MDPRVVVEELRRICRELDAGLTPCRARALRALRAASIPVALGLGGGLACPSAGVATPPAAAADAEADAAPAGPVVRPVSPRGAADASVGPTGEAAAADAGLGGDAAAIGHGGGAGYGVGVYGAPFSRTPPPLELTLSVGRVDGPLSREVVHRFVRRHTPMLRHCLETELEDGLAPSGAVVAQATIDGSGRTGAVTVAPRPARSAPEPVGPCIEAALRRMVFPADAESRTTTAEVTLAWHRRSGGRP